MPAGYLRLATGEIFTGEWIGSTQPAAGEVVFTTRMTGYQEILTDPSFAGQIVTFTYPLIGNYGIQLDDNESGGPHLAGVIVSELCNSPSHYGAVKKVELYLRENRIPALTGVDTRALVKTIRKYGTVPAVMAPGVPEEEAWKRVDSPPPFTSAHWVQTVSTSGQPGMEDAYAMRRMMAEKWGIPEHLVAVASTGLIGERIPMEKVAKGIAQADRPEHQGAEHFEEAILTTDTCPKHYAVQVEVDGKLVTIGGAAKGSGMIHPNMGTMLAFITTDAHVPHPVLLEALRKITDETFNMITVDGDTSTNDMVLVLANGKAYDQPLDPSHRGWPAFYTGLATVCRELAKQIARDGEGATRLIEVKVTGAPDDETAKAVGKAIVGSNLVKAAVYGKDPNWGRIVCAAGYSGQPFDPERIRVQIGPVLVVDQGLPVAFDEEEAKKVLGADPVRIEVDLNQGTAQAVVWGCDLTYEYVRINALYRT